MSKFPPSIAAPVVAALLLAALLLAATGCGDDAPRREEPLSVVLVTFDTTRPDHLSVYGYRRPTSPALDALAARGTRFDDASTLFPETGPSLATVMTSRRPAATSVLANGERLDPRVATLANVASSRGLATAAFVSTVLLRHDVCGLDAGFDVYDDTLTDPCFGHPNAQRVGARTVDAALSWLAAAKRPYFLWVHLYDPHGPYDAPQRTPRLDATRDTLTSLLLDRHAIPAYQRVGDSLDAADYVNRYDHEIAYADAQLARLSAAVDATTTLVAVHADHGEALGEDDYWFRHGSLLHDAALRIPLVLAGPGVPVGAVESHPIRTLDLAPTLIELAHWDTPLPQAEGRAWRPGAPPPEARTRIAEARAREFVVDGTGIDTRHKLRLVEPGLDVTWWPATDERTAVGDASRVDDAVTRLRAWMLPPAGLPAPRAPAPDDVPDALKALGYR